MHGDVAVVQTLERENLLVAGRASASEYVFSPTEWPVGNDFCSKSYWRKWTWWMCCMHNIPELEDRVREEAFLIEREC